MRLAMPISFPEEEFVKFGTAASKFFPRVLSNEYMDDPLMRRPHFDRAWLAVRYRYRACADCNEEFRNFLVDGVDWWPNDEEKNYTLDRYVYQFFTNALSIFESFGFCLYFLGHTVEPNAFLSASNPRGITLKATNQAFQTAFAQASITTEIANLLNDNEFSSIDAVRNILAHRCVGMRSASGYGIMHANGTYTETSEETWNLLGANEKMLFDDALLQRHLNGIASLLTPLVRAARDFAETYQLTEAAS